MPFLNFFRWAENKIYLGEVIKDYGTLSESWEMGAKFTISLLLCKRNGELRIVLRRSAVASVSYTYIPIEDAAKIRDVIDDILSLAS